MLARKTFERLPTTVKPYLYDLFIKPNLNTFQFDGTAVISIKILEPTDKIKLNCIDLKLNLVEIKLLSSGKTVVPDLDIVTEDETVALLFPDVLPAGDAELKFEFVGELNDKMKGFYRLESSNSLDKNVKYCAMTQFEATDARRCFPCWDEPVLKARFDITLAVEDGKTALSNMPVKEEYKNGDGLRVIKFERTPIMSTYLVAFVIGDFDYIEDTSSDGVLIRVYTPVGKKEQGRFALHVSKKVLPYYKEYFGIAYPLPKMDLVAVTKMSAAAMENWGLITARETYLLVDDVNSSASTRQTVAIVVGHEFAHQWFGNLVTMEWWTHLWLNEGYASFIEFLCVDYLFPEYDIWTQFVTDAYCRALELDGLKNSHPIEIQVGHPSEIDEIFDDISYDKGASVIRMLHRYIGDDDFRKGMNLYLTRHQYNNAFTEDLWSALEEASKKPIKAVMSTWTQQTGFPVITIESSVQEENNVRTLHISQTKFCVDTSNQDNDSLWMIPLSFCKQENPSKICYSTILDCRKSKISIPNVSPDEWVKLNPGTVEFYRIKYPLELLKQFISSVENKTLPPLDRLNLLDDLFALVQAGQCCTTHTLDLMQAMKNEDNYTVWCNISVCLEKIRNLLSFTDFSDMYNIYGLKLMKPIYNKLNIENQANEKHLTTLLRSLVLHRLIHFEDEEFLEIAKKKFEDHCNGIRISADLRSVIYKAVIHANGKEAYNSLLSLYRETDLQEEKDRILRSFSAVVDKDLVEEMLEFSQSKQVSDPNAVTAVTAIGSSKVGRNRIWEFLKENWESIYERYSGGFLLTRMVKCCTENFASEEKAKEIEEFFSHKITNGVERTISQSLETVRNNAAWLLRDKTAIKNYLMKNV